eukprot:g21742.t1
MVGGPAFEVRNLTSGEMLVHHLGVWEHHLGAEMMCRADQIPSHAIEPREAARPPRQVSRIVQAEEVRDDEWLLCRSRSGSPTSESDWTVIDRALINIGPENPKVIQRAKELLSPDDPTSAHPRSHGKTRSAHSTLFALQAENMADNLRAELSIADPSPEAGDRRRGCAMALAVSRPSMCAVVRKDGALVLGARRRGWAEV